jgi:hypothetical protein
MRSRSCCAFNSVGLPAMAASSEIPWANAAVGENPIWSGVAADMSSRAAVPSTMERDVILDISLGSDDRGPNTQGFAAILRNSEPAIGHAT